MIQGPEGNRPWERRNHVDGGPQTDYTEMGDCKGETESLFLGLSLSLSLSFSLHTHTVKSRVQASRSIEQSSYQMIMLLLWVIYSCADKDYGWKGQCPPASCLSEDILTVVLQ